MGRFSGSCQMPPPVVLAGPAVLWWQHLRQGGSELIALPVVEVSSWLGSSVSNRITAAFLLGGMVTPEVSAETLPHADAGGLGVGISMG